MKLTPATADLSAVRSMGRVQHLHFVGIGGAGMCGIAEVLLTEGYRISGSDLQQNANTQHLQRLGARIFIGHRPENTQGADVLVQSSAIAADNPEIVHAQLLRIPVVPRAEMLAQLMRFRYGIAVAGTHGKTTTTSLVASVLAQAGLDPTFVVGGQLNGVASNARLGASRYLVAEADESDASFLRLKPEMLIVTNIDRDHMSSYRDFNHLQTAFLEFIHGLPFYGFAIVCLDDPVVQSLLDRIARPVITYGFHPEADLRVSHYTQQGFTAKFVVYRSGLPNLPIELAIPGRHNALNATAAIAVAEELGVPQLALQQALKQFAGVGRRLQILGELPVAQGKVLLIDDYGHHPREIQVTLQALRYAVPGKRITIIFQPHRYSRTQELWQEFVNALLQADDIGLMPVYPAGEAPLAEVTSERLAAAITSHSQRRVQLYQNYQDLLARLPELLHGDSVLLMQGAGSIGKFAKQLVNDWGEGDAAPRHAAGE